VDLANPFLLMACVLAALGTTAWVAFRAGRAAEPPRPNPEQFSRTLADITSRLERMERLMRLYQNDFSEEANAARKLIDARLHEALDLLARRAELEERAWPHRSRAAGA